MNRFVRLMVLLLCATFPLAGCAGKRIEPTRTVRVAVLDGDVLFDVLPEGEVRQAGWWFGSHDRTITGNAGAVFGEVMAHEMRKLPGVEVYSREDLGIYMAQKERMLRRAYPGIEATERKKLLAKQSPVDFGKSLNVDYVVRTEIAAASTVTNRTFPWWHSSLDCIVEVWDTAKGQAVYKAPWRGTGDFTSLVGICERAARRVAKKMRRDDAFQVMPAE